MSVANEMLAADTLACKTTEQETASEKVMEEPQAAQKTGDAVKPASDDEKMTDEAADGAKMENKPKFIHLRLVEGTTTFETYFRVKTTSALDRLKSTYAEKMNLKLEDCRFLFKGERILDLDTAQSLNMKEGDMVEVYQPFFGIK